MNDRTKLEKSADEWMKLHIDALFTQDERSRLRNINEPWPGSGPAPRFYLGRTIAGTTCCRFRVDVPDPIVERLEALCAEEPDLNDLEAKPKSADAYMALLQSRNFEMGPCYVIPPMAATSSDAVRITRENMDGLLRDGFEWLRAEIDYAQPCIAIVRDNRAVSICRSVRITPRAHEAGLETLDEYRGKGYAGEAVAGWASAVREAGSLPMYSTSWENRSSRRVAEKLALGLYGVEFSIR
ncbi:GNAT family N-acetyltransferase [Paenibacillus sp. GYB003]|uniref:GNAT family N-acetyltransferase n=1 Tax=Paenibacillus sp. GYB003 TaxID=2994392 RepID=UPI002F962577